MLATRKANCADCGRPFEAPYAKYCSDCRWKHRTRHPIFTWTPERDAYLRQHYQPGTRGIVREIARALGVPRWRVTRRLAVLGIGRERQSRRAWTKEEESFLWQKAGTRHLNWLAKQLGRTPCSVANKLKDLRISRRFREGYTLRDLEECFGVDHRVIERWASEGKLAKRNRGSFKGPRDAWYVTDADVLRFIQAYPMEFELRRVNQLWFMDLMLGGGVVARALGIAKGDEEEAEDKAA